MVVEWFKHVIVGGCWQLRRTLAKDFLVIAFFEFFLAMNIHYYLGTSQQS